MKKSTPTLLKKHMEELSVVEPNDLGLPLLTAVYRRINGFFKTMPFIFVVPLSLIVSIGVVYLFGLLAVRLVSVLQYGF